MAVTFAAPHLILADDERRYERYEEWRHQFSRDDRRRLEGTWYLNGERDKPCTIFSSRDGLQARNERGETSRLVPVVMDLSGHVTGKVDYVAKSDARASNGLTAQLGRGLHLAVRACVYFLTFGGARYAFLEQSHLNAVYVTRT